MSLEMLASRYLNPYFGGTIFTWAALISVVLLAMMVGYFTGGYSVDKIKSPYILEGLIIVAALYLLCLPYFVDPLLEWVVGAIEDVKLGALVGAFIITGPPVACLSTFTPIAIGRTLSDLNETGRISGTIFATSTFGNIFGTLLTSFYLIPHFGTRSLTQSLALVLMLAVVLSFTAQRIRRASPLILIMLCACLLVMPTSLEAKSRDVIAANAAYPEGPVFIKDTLYYTEMTRDRVMRVKQGTHNQEPSSFFFEKNCGPTALASFGTDKIVILCHLSDALKIVSKAGKLISTIKWATRSKGKGANIPIFHPNDCIKDEKGGVYITAPGHFSKKYQPMGRLFYLNPNGQVDELDDGLTYPNGVAIYKGQLYVAEHLAGRVIKYPIIAPGKLGKPSLFAKTPNAKTNDKQTKDITGPDGIEISKDGTIYVAHYGAGEILVYNKQGKPLKTIKTRPQFVTNMVLTSKGSLIITGAKELDGKLQVGEVYVISK